MIQQGTDDWFKERLGIPTASMFTVLMAGDKYAGWKNYMAQLAIERITGKPTETFQSKEMAWGTDTEPLARLYYTLKSGNVVEECGFYRIEGADAGASPDGLIGEDGTLEIKCPNPATHIETLRTGQVPKQYVAQVQGQLWATGRKWADFASFDPRMPEHARIIIIPVPRDDIFIEKLESRVAQFNKELDNLVKFIQNYGHNENNIQS